MHTLWTSSSNYIAPIFVLFIAYLGWTLLYRLYISPLANIPGPKLAAIHDIFGFRMSDVPSGALHALHKQYGPVVRVGPNEVTVTSPADISKIYGVEAGLLKAPIYDLFGCENAVGPMFVMRDEHIHKARRRLLNPAYSRTSVMVIQPWLFKQCELLCNQMERAAMSDQPVDLVKHFRMLAGDTALKMAFNLEGNMVKEASVHPIMKYIQMEMALPYFILNFARRLIPVMTPLVKALLPSTLLEQIFAMRTIDSLSEGYLRKYLGTMKKDASAHKEVLSRIVNATDPVTGEKLSINELTAESRSLVLAGADTTAITLSYAGWLIFQSPTVLSTLRAEVLTVMPDHKTLPLDLATLESLPYLTACIYEVMRLYPAIPGPWPREVPKGGLEIGGYFLPEKSILGANALVVNRSHPEIWGKDPEEFRPERWIRSDADVSAMRKAFVAFGAGPRSCIGRNIAMMQLYAMLAAFIARFDGRIVSRPENMLPAGTFNLAPKGGECLAQLSPAT